MQANWEATNFYAITYMQEMTPAVCNSIATPTTAPTRSATTLATYESGTFTGSGANLRITNYVPERTLIDSRDNSTYVVRKLADGNCWMISNLKIVGPKTLTPADSDIASGSYNLPASSLSFGTSAFSENVLSGSTSIPGWSSEAGAYYSRGVVVANSTKTATTSGYYATNSICPAGWRLPARYGINSSNSAYSKSFQKLKDSYPSIGAAAFPLNFAPGGGGHMGGSWNNMANLPNNATYAYTYWTSYVEMRSENSPGQYATVHIFTSNSTNWMEGGCWNGNYGCSAKCVSK